jgi:hypothetical protein
VQGLKAGSGKESRDQPVPACVRVRVVLREVAAAGEPTPTIEHAASTATNFFIGRLYDGVYHPSRPASAAISPCSRQSDSDARICSPLRL